MRFTTSLAVALTLPSALLAGSVVVEERSHPETWTRTSAPLDPNASFDLHFGLAQQNLHTLHDELHRVSDPESESYGQHWTPQKIRDHFAPTTDTVDTVQSWLKSAGHHDSAISPNGAWLTVKMTVAQAEELLEARYSGVQHEETGYSTIACDSYSVPDFIRDHIELIKPTLHYDHPAGNFHDINKKIEPRTSVDLNKRAGIPPVSAPKPVTEPVGRVVNPAHKIALGFLDGDVLPGPKKTSDPPVPQGAFVSSTELANCGTAMTPNCLKSLYNFGSYKVVPASTSSNTSPTAKQKTPGSPVVIAKRANTPVTAGSVPFGVAEYGAQSYIPSDLDMFFNTFSPSQVGARPALVSIAGGSVNPKYAGFAYNGESNLDLEYAMQLTNGIPVSLFQVGTASNGGSFNMLLDAVDASYCFVDGNIFGQCGGSPRPDVLSTSYSYNEGDLTPLYEQRQCQEYGKLGLMGSTLVFSSGDYGVGGAGGTCYIAGTQNKVTAGYNGLQRFNPAFPSTCPYVLSVGGTQLKPNTLTTAANPESATRDVIQSGGGFSNVFGAPAYQQPAINNYYKNYAPPYSGQQYNNSRTSRGFPDISANGAYYIVSVNGAFYQVFGTSASAPTVASMLVLINNARAGVGKAPVGFVNSALYSAAFASSFTDITSGNNAGCGTPGFSAVPGWDPNTGLGTPIFPKMLAAFMALP